MNSTLEKQNQKELELANLFEVEELEERIEFGAWSADGSGNYTPATGDGNFDVTLTVGISLY